jgi:polar amino acid transport system permease protein
VISFQVILSCLPAFGEGLIRTLELVALAAVLGMVLGFVLNALRQLSPPWVGTCVHAYVAVLRGTPYLAQLYLIYFGLPAIGIALDPFTSASFSLTLYTSAYAAEIFRGCWATLAKGQTEAAHVLGISPWRSFIHLEAPQALRLARPLLVNQAILTLKESSLASLVTYPELTMQAGRLVSEQFVYVEPYLLLALSYWGLSLFIQAIGHALRRPLAKKS